MRLSNFILIAFVIFTAMGVTSFTNKADNASTTLSADAGVGETSLSVEDGSAFPLSNFRVTIENAAGTTRETVICSSRSGNTMTIGALSYSWIDGDTVDLRATADDWTAVQDGINDIEDGTTATVANITSGNISGITDLAVEDGGTGSSTAAAAADALGVGATDTVTFGPVVSGADDITTGSFTGYGNSTTGGASLNLYNGASNDTVTEYWTISPNNKLEIKDSSGMMIYTFGQFGFAAGADDSKQGALVARGNGGSGGGYLDLYNGGTNDTTVDKWRFIPDSDLRLDRDNTEVLSVSATTGAFDFAVALADSEISSATDWNTAYTDRLKWNGGATGLTAATGRTSLELGSADSVTFGTLALGVDDTTAGTATIYGGTSTDNGSVRLHSSTALSQYLDISGDSDFQIDGTSILNLDPTLIRFFDAKTFENTGVFTGINGGKGTAGAQDVDAGTPPTAGTAAYYKGGEGGFANDGTNNGAAGGQNDFSGGAGGAAYTGGDGGAGGATYIYGGNGGDTYDAGGGATTGAGGDLYLYGGKPGTVQGTGSAGAYGDLILAHDGASQISNVGIGTASPTGILTVSGGTAATDTAGTAITLTAQDGGTDGGTASNGQDGGDVTITTGDGSAAVTTDANGGYGGSLFLELGAGGAGDGAGSAGNTGPLLIGNSVLGSGDSIPISFVGPGANVAIFIPDGNAGTIDDGQDAGSVLIAGGAGGDAISSGDGGDGTSYYLVPGAGGAGDGAGSAGADGNWSFCYDPIGDAVVGKVAIGVAAGAEMLTVAGNITYTGVLYSPPETFTADDTTPDVSGGNVFVIPGTWTSGNNITDFDGGTAGQQIVIIGGDSDCDVTDGGNLKLAGNWTATADSTLTLVYAGSAWYELSRSAN